MASEKVHVRVRMYRHGLGDCFLLTFRHRDNPGGGSVGSSGNPNAGAFHILIDCGLLNTNRTTEQRAKDLENINNVVRNVRDETRDPVTGRGHLHVVVATHRHWDHVSGFAQAKDVFDEIDVDEVWSPWTEDDEDEDARALWKRSAQGLRAIYAAFQLFEQRSAQKRLSLAGEANKRKRKEIEEALDGQAAVWSGILRLSEFEGNVAEGELLDLLGLTQDKFGAIQSIIKRVPRDKQRYFDAAPEGVTLPPFAVAGCAGVRFYVLGPTREEKYLKRMDPLKSNPADDTYELTALSLAESLSAAATHLAASAGGGAQAVTVDRYAPFDDKEGRYSVLEQAAQSDPAFAPYYAAGSGWRGIEENWLELASSLALLLDTVTNNTSLVLAIELVASRKVLLFVGDAQVGNWMSWLDRVWTVQEENNETRTVRVLDLFNRTVLYKVGHHGSHNATLKTNGLERMIHDDLVAMIPVNSQTAREQSNVNNPDGWEMPAHKLFDSLTTRTGGRILSADKPLPTAAELAGLSPAEQQAFLNAAKFTAGDLWMDWEIEG